MRRIFGFIFLSSLLCTPVLARADFWDIPELVNVPSPPSTGEKTGIDEFTEDTCGNGTWEPTLGEECDDGNHKDGDGCNGNCKKEPETPISKESDPPIPIYGSLPPPPELNLNPKEPPTLPPAVKTPDCGDAIKDPGEECDDGNNIDGDGCNANCGREPACGDSTIDPGEACDDGNLVNGDGCNDSCQKEPPPPSHNNPPGRTDLPPTQATNPGIIMEGSGCSLQSGSTSPWATYMLWILIITIPALGRKLFPHNQ